MPPNQTARTNNPSIPRPYSPATHQLPNRSNLTTGSATQTLTNTPQRSESPDPLVLRLRGAHSPQPTTVDSTASSDNTSSRRRAHIQWAEDVVDNEGLGRKKSKVCCIYHKPRAAGESSDESSSDSSSGSDSDDGDGARPANGRKGRGRHEDSHGHKDGDGCGHDHGKPQKKPRRKPSPNAYEKMPKYDVKPLTQQPGSGS